MPDYVVTSPLSAWTGEFTLPHPDEFNRVHWDTWKRAYDTPKRKTYSMVHLNAYSGLALIAAHGNWNMSVPLKEVRAWEDDPAAERVKFIAWISREVFTYLEQVTNPKG